jgi:hypothetical protein
MPEHYYAEHKPRRKKLRIFIRSIVIIMLIGIFITVGWVVSNYLDQPEPEPVTSGVQTSVEVSPLSVFRTAYFQFQASDKWIEDAKSSTDTMYVYRAYRGRLIEHDLQIYINPSSSDIARFRASRVVAASPTSEGALSPINGISDHCGESVEGPNRSPQEVVFEGVSFVCMVDGVIFDVLVGVQGGSSSVRLNRPSGGSATYLMYYRDLRANPDGRELEEIINSFQAR